MERERIPEDLLLGVRDYERLSAIQPHLTYQEIEIFRFVAREKTVKETVYCLGISISTVNNHLDNIHRKFRIHNSVGVLKLAVSQGILLVGDLMTYTVSSVKI